MLRAGLIVALLAGALLGPPLTDGARAQGPAVDESPTAWLVELSGAPVTEGGSAAGALREREDFLAAATRQGLRLRERFAYDGLFNGVSVEAGAGQVPGLRRLPGVRAVYPVFPVSLPPLTTSDPALATAPQLTGADVAQALGFSGEGVRVAVMDSGIDYHHPDLGGCFGSGCRVAFGHDFVGDAYNFDSASPSFNPIPRPDGDPDDCPSPTGDAGGHGTHVAGIVGANGKVQGVAPRVTLGAYRVFGCNGATSSDVMLAAMERALLDRVQVLNMSIGSVVPVAPVPHRGGGRPPRAAGRDRGRLVRQLRRQRALLGERPRGGGARDRGGLVRQHPPRPARVLRLPGGR